MLYTEEDIECGALVFFPVGVFSVLPEGRVEPRSQEPLLCVLLVFEIFQFCKIATCQNLSDHLTGLI